MGFYKQRYGYRFWKRPWFPLLCAIILLLLTFANPSLTLQRAIYRYVFVFDITQSMNVTDMGESSVDRLSFAKQQLSEAINLLPCGSEAGLALFSGHRVFLLFLPVEICAHYGELVNMINSIDWRMAWEARSEVAKGLHKGIGVVHDLGDDTRVVFISDGHEAPPVHADYRPAFRGEPGAVKGFIVGVGGNIPVPIPKLNAADGRLHGYWQAHEVMQIDRYRSGRSGTGNEQMVGVDSSDIAQRIQAGTEHLSSLRENYLQRLAKETGLGYHRLQNSNEFAVQLTSENMALTEPRVTDLRWLLVLSALLLVLLPYFKDRARALKPSG